MIGIDPLLFDVALISLLVIVMGVLSKVTRQPYVITYILTGILLGSHALGVVDDPELIMHLGNIGVVLLLFFVGMELKVDSFMKHWRISAYVTVFQLVLSVVVMVVLGGILSWELRRILLLGFIISLTSTAVILKLLDEWKLADSRMGSYVSTTTIMQDLTIIPMMIILTFLSTDGVSVERSVIQIASGIALMGLIAFLMTRKQIHLPVVSHLGKDRELQVFVALGLLCGCAILTALVGLSTSLGAFLAGILVAKSKETHWVHASLSSFRVVFVALFFVSIGLLLDIEFLRENAWLVGFLLLVVYTINTLITVAILRFIHIPWRDSLIAAALLAQVGELSFVLVAFGLDSSIITSFSYQVTIAVITLSLLFSPVWILAVKLLSSHRRFAQ